MTATCTKQPRNLLLFNGPTLYTCIYLILASQVKDDVNAAEDIQELEIVAG